MQLFDRVLVTGGAGFIGSHTVDALLNAEIEVWVLDNLSTGLRTNLIQRKRNHRFHFIRGNIRNLKTVEKLTRTADAIIHLAAIVSPFISVQRPEITNDINVGGTLNILRAASKHRVKKIVFASSSSVYGDTGKHARINENAPTNPMTPYGASKLAAEKYCQAFCSTYEINAVSLRYFNVYGERQKDNPYSGVMAIFVNKLLNNHRPVVFGDGRQTRDFIHVTDVARANLIALQCSRGRGEAFNIGTGTATSINEVYTLIARQTVNPHLRPIRKPPRTGDIRDSCADVRKSWVTLGFKPRISLNAGLDDMIRKLRR